VIKFHTDAKIECDSVELRKKSLNAISEAMFYAKFVSDLIEGNQENAETCKKVFSGDEDFVKNLLDGTLRTDAEKAYEEQFRLLLDDPEANASNALREAILTNDSVVPLTGDLRAQLTDFFSILV
jgi:hypothetical protein